MDYETIYNSNKQESLFGRYITLNDIEPILLKFNTNNQLKKIGFSVQNKPIYSYTIGSGKIKILIWSQMHGNESTTTKSIIDLLNLLQNNSRLSSSFLRNFTFCIIPILNPDGATLYTRENANKIDLNRDFKELSQPESNILMQVFEDFNPDFCYNMHDQRTIYGIESSRLPATVSFLAPSYNSDREYNKNRIKAASIIIDMNKVLQQYIPNQVGRFDDGFNDNCAGETFQSKGIPTILFESGHFIDDFDRETTRKYIFIAMVASFIAIDNNTLKLNIIDDYLKIPKNNAKFFDFIYKNIKIIRNNSEETITFAVQYLEELKDNKIEFNAKIEKIENLENCFGHFEFDAKGLLFNNNEVFEPKLESNANFKLGDNIHIINGKMHN